MTRAKRLTYEEEMIFTLNTKQWDATTVLVKD